MDRERLLLDVASGLRSLAKTVQALAETESCEAGSAAKAPDEPKALTLEQVRSVLAEKSRDGHTDAVRSLLEKHGAAKLSEIDPAKYAELLKDAEGLGNG
jgi:hypothetical protein